MSFIVVQESDHFRRYTVRTRGIGERDAEVLAGCGEGESLPVACNDLASGVSEVGQVVLA